MEQDWHIDYNAPEREWKSLYYSVLVEVEEDGLPQEFPLQEVLLRLPTFSLISSIVGLLSGTVAFAVASWFVRDCAAECGWWSGILMNLSMGMLTGLVLLWFSNRQQRIIAGYEAVVSVLRQRQQSFALVAKILVDPGFVTFTLKNELCGIGWYHAHLNYLYVIKNHLVYLDRYLSLKVDLGLKEIINRLSADLDELSKWHRKGVGHTTEETKDIFHKLYRIERCVLATYTALAENLQCKVYNIKFGHSTTLRGA